MLFKFGVDYVISSVDFTSLWITTKTNNNIEEPQTRGLIQCVPKCADPLEMKDELRQIVFSLEYLALNNNETHISNFNNLLNTAEEDGQNGCQEDKLTTISYEKRHIQTDMVIIKYVTP